jgi:hypothetical protein
MSDHDQVKMTNMNYDVNRPKAENPVKVMDLSLRDGHQSLFATRGRTEDMIPVAELMDQVGFWAVETWGGATFDTMHRFLNEDPWERIRTLKRYFKKTPFSMLLRAQNLVGYRNYADDVANAFMDRACENGMDIFRTFDALNDYRNFQTVVPKIKEYGKHFQGCICYTMTEPRLGGEVYNLDYYVNKAKDLEAMGADSICVKDMAGLIAPYDAYAIVKALKENCQGTHSPAQPLHLGHVTHEPPQGHRSRCGHHRHLHVALCLPHLARRHRAAGDGPAGHQPRHGLRHQADGPDQRDLRKRGHAQVQAPAGRLQDVHHRHQRAASPDPGRDALQPGQPAARHGRPGQDRRGLQRTAQSPQRPRPDSPGDPHQPDRGHPDRQQRALRHAGRALQDDYRPG